MNREAERMKRELLEAVDTHGYGVTLTYYGRGRWQIQVCMAKGAGASVDYTDSYEEAVWLYAHSVIVRGGNG